MRVPVAMVVHGLGQAPQSGAPLVLLKESGRERYLIIGVGPFEILSIATALAGKPPPRPMTHDLLCNAIAACGGRVTHAVVHSIVDGTFYARLVLDVQGRHAELDARSSDAIAVALRLGIPVLVEEAVLERAGFTATSEYGSPEHPTGQDRISEEQLGAFRDVIRGLDLDDLGHPGPTP